MNKMSLFEETEKEIIRQNQIRVPPIRKLFSSQTIEESDQDSRQDLETFKVFLRIKPVPDYDFQRNTIKIVNSSKLVCKPPTTSRCHKAECVEYTFSRIFGAKSTQNDIFNDCVVPCIRDLVDMQNSLIFTYGTTNAGKTYTVQGNQSDPGIIPRALYSLFTNISPDTRAIYGPYMAKNIIKLGSEKSQDELNLTEEILRVHLNNSKILKGASCYEVLNYEYRQLIGTLDENFIELNAHMPACTIWISFIELYNETIFDLLEFSGCPRKPLKLSVDKHNNFYVKGLKHIVVRSFEEAYTIYRIGKKNLSIASTKMNENSSRSHCIFTIKLINHKHKVLSNLSICDLAGTERQTKAQNFGMRLKESGIINGSLFQLNRCLRALRDNQTKNTSQLIPFRQSNLTKLFHSALNDKTDEKIVMIVNINPLAELYDETQQVLKMCAIASKIKSKPIMSKILRHSTRFTSYVYGPESCSLDEDQQYENDFSSCEEDSAEVQYEEIQLLKEQLASKDRELSSMKQQYEDCCALYKNSQNMLTEYMATVENDQKELEESFKRRLELTEKHYERKLEKLKTNSQYLCSDNDLRNEILEKDLLIEELKLQLSNKNDGRQCLNTAKLQEEMCEKNKKIDELESLLADGKTEYMAVVDQLNSMSEKLSSLENQLQDKTEFAEALEMNLSQKQVTIEDLEARIENLEEYLSENAIEHEGILSNLEKEWNKTKEELSLARAELATAQENKNILASRKEELEDEMKDLKEIVNKLTQDIDSMNLLTTEQKELILTLEKECSEAREEKARLEGEIERLKEKNGDLTQAIKQVDEQAITLAEMEKQLNMTKKELMTVHQENELLKEEIKIQKEKANAELEVKEHKRYNTRNNRTPLKQLGKENKLVTSKTPNNNSSSKSRKTKQPKDKLFKVDTLNDSIEPELFRIFDSENANKENTTGRKKKLFSTPVSENLISFNSAEKDKGSFLDCNFDEKSKSEVATPAQTMKSVLRKKRFN